MIYIDFWSWFTGAHSSNESSIPGYKRVINEWMFFHSLVGLVLCFLTTGMISNVAKILIIPLSGALVGVTFAWSGNISALVMSSEISDVTKDDEKKFYDYVYTFQLTALVIITTICLWAVSALEIFDSSHSFLSFCANFVLYTLASCSVREGWHVILGVNSLTVIRFNVRKANKKKNEKKE